MKQILTFTLVLSFFILMLCFPQTTFLGASKGLLLWFQTLLPTLLPFMIISNLLICTNSVGYISRFLKPLFQRLFCISERACYPVLVGFLCGYPMGAKAVADCTRMNHISKEEGQYLLSFCNNTSLMYIMSFLVLQNFNDSSLLLGTLFILLLSPILCSFLFRHFSSKSTRKHTLSQRNNHLIFHFQIVDDSIMNGFESITKIGGYVILFSILFAIGEQFPFKWFLPALEITGGTTTIFSWNLPFQRTYPLVLSLTSFGGVCSIAQTYSMIQGSGLSIKPYIIQKLITAMVTSLLAFSYVLLSH